MKEVGSLMAVRDFTNISVAKVESSFMFILILDSNSSKCKCLLKAWLLVSVFYHRTIVDTS